jgi:hypothetical protein
MGPILSMGEYTCNIFRESKYENFNRQYLREIVTIVLGTFV